MVAVTSLVLGHLMMKFNLLNVGNGNGSHGDSPASHVTWSGAGCTGRRKLSQRPSQREHAVHHTMVVCSQSRRALNLHLPW